MIDLASPLILLIGALSTPSSGGSSPGVVNRPELLTRVPTVTQTLVADAESDAELTSVTVESFENNRTLNIKISSDRHEDAFEYYIMADMMSATYRAFAVRGNPFHDPRVRAYLQQLRPRLQSEGQWHRYERLLTEAAAVPNVGRTMYSTAAEPPPICTSCPSDRLCNGNAFSRAYTWDPAYYDLTHTDNTLYWSRDDSPSGCQWNARQVISCWGANPSPLNTHWYVDSCLFGPLDKDDMYASGMTQGAFHNDDFLDPYQRTWVRNNALAMFDGGVITHGFQFQALGEGYQLLDATVAGTHINNCIY